MYTISRTNWLFYFGSAVVTIIVSWVFSSGLTGCRLGNHVEQLSQTDKVSGYYETQPQTLKFCATHGSVDCKPATTNKIPGLLSQIFSNPVALILQNPSTGRAAFTRPKGDGSALPVYLGSDGRLSYLVSTSPQIIWKDRACTGQLFLAESGKILKDTGPYTSGTSLPLSGRIQLQVQVINSFDGNCGPTLTALYRCYLSASQCGGTSPGENQQQQQEVQDLFGPYIDAGAMAPADIPNTSYLAYEVFYQ